MNHWPNEEAYSIEESKMVHVCINKTCVKTLIRVVDIDNSIFAAHQIRVQK